MLSCLLRMATIVQFRWQVNDGILQTELQGCHGKRACLAPLTGPVRKESDSQCRGPEDGGALQETCSGWYGGDP